MNLTTYIATIGLVLVLYSNPLSAKEVSFAALADQYQLNDQKDTLKLADDFASQGQHDLAANMLSMATSMLSLRDNPDPHMMGELYYGEATLKQQANKPLEALVAINNALEKVPGNSDYTNLHDMLKGSYCK
mgnify:CR=1 FL=1|tara:strand:+ start:115 stop:510 length:396 start_codon:yes stop_codon:yes gene_type:complete